MAPYAIEWDYYVPEILTPGGVGIASVEDVDCHSQKLLSVNLLWDTGAVSSVIASRIAKKLGLVAVGKRNHINSHGLNTAFLYIVNLLLPNGILIKNLTVGADELPDVDFLVGMDVINMMDFSITHRNGRTRFAFEMTQSI